MTTTLSKLTGRGIAIAAALVGAVTVATPQPARADVSPGWAAAIGLGSFALGAALSRPYYGYSYGYAGYPYYGGYGSWGYPYYGYGYPYGYGSYMNYSYGSPSYYGSPYYGSSYGQPYYGYSWGY